MPFPPTSMGPDKTIAILQFGGTFSRSDYDACMKLNGVTAGEVLTKTRRRGRRHSPGETEFDTELALDTQIAGDSHQVRGWFFYTAPHSERGFSRRDPDGLVRRRVPAVDSLDQLRLGPKASGPMRRSKSSTTIFAAAALIGVSVFASSGDSGADDFDGKPHVAVAGVEPLRPRLRRDARRNGRRCDRERERLEPDRGRLQYREAPRGKRTSTNKPRCRAARADAASPTIAAQVIPGYRIVRDGVPTAAGGTSTVAPLWAALTARLNEALGVPLGFYAPLLYERAAKGTLFRKIERGSTGVSCAPGVESVYRPRVAHRHRAPRSARGAARPGSC